MDKRHEELERTDECQYRREGYARVRRGTVVFAVLLALVIVPLALLATRALPKELPEQTVIRRLMGVDAEVYGDVMPMMDLEEIWALEDGRTQAQTPLITSMKNGEDMLGYDAAQETFYCTLGLETGNDWPEISLSAAGAEGVQVVFVDDYAYDWCADAIREGYRYELFAYTQTQYAYIGVVFTGLPIVSIHTQDSQAIEWEDVGAQVRIAASGYDALSSYALVHQRGGIRGRDVGKTSYRMELHALDLKGQDTKRSQSVLGMEADSDWLLIGSPLDETGVINQICFDLWREWYDGEGVAMLESRMVEVFVNDEYVGLYQLMQRIDPEKEIKRMGADPNHTVVVRKISALNEGDRPRVDLAEDNNAYQFELRYAPATMTSDQAFEAIDNFKLLESPDLLSDEEYTALAAQCLDMEQLMNYILFFHACCLEKDNVFNNVYVWAERGDDGLYHYQLSVWDMDLAFHRIRVSPDIVEDVLNPYMGMATRVLNLNVNNCRELFWEIWEEKRATLFSDDAIYQRFIGMEEMINASGAYLRESEKWRGGAQELDLSERLAQATVHLSTMDRDMIELWPPEQ